MSSELVNMVSEKLNEVARTSQLERRREKELI